MIPEQREQAIEAANDKVREHYEHFAGGAWKGVSPREGVIIGLVVDAVESAIRAEVFEQGVREGRAGAFDEALEIATELRTRWETGESSRAWGAVAALEEFAERLRSLGADD